MIVEEDKCELIDGYIRDNNEWQQHGMIHWFLVVRPMAYKGYSDPHILLVSCGGSDMARWLS